DFDWAMSSGTIVWGLYNSLFKADSLAGIIWLQTYGQYLPLYYDNNNAGTYIWDSSWNVALANGYRAIHQHTNQTSYDQYHQVLTDTLLALDVDD
ncbi:MAG: hypothetical protein GWO08_01175, partial [Gammaproteobacteria bacterium]|nr:hypothetical protein [Gammaproteobacteria bacterium]NIT54708.1 hypothetical protein [Fodinibius sp.]NIW43221.1 hypothetical protein [Gammaproteobacteria bacterium]NIX54561.1 hypothetical protein [candidate division Zixibacteria bacterium]NIY23292.1 hypothetical protein [Fodinibius sp.]